MFPQACGVIEIWPSAQAEFQPSTVPVKKQPNWIGQGEACRRTGKFQSPRPAGERKFSMTGHFGYPGASPARYR
jgi:hypothetical protein